MRNKFSTRGLPILMLMLLATMSLGMLTALPVNPAYAVTQSSNVLIVPNPQCSNGGTLPYSTGAWTGFTFTTNVAWSYVSAANLAAYDTVVLQIDSGYSASSLNATQKSDLISWVANGGKLIIYDSEEVPGVDYSWLPYPFTTKNPGAYGYIFPIVYLENNTLGDTIPASPYYLDTDQSPSWSDYVGDCNFFVTYDSHWCGDIKAHNRYSYPSSYYYDGSAPSWAHAYAEYGDGLFIYNGFDIDPMYSTLQPGTSGTQNCAKIWYMELMQPWGSDYNLPCGVRVVGITLKPETDTNPVGASHTVTATVKDDYEAPQANVTVDFEVLTGPNAGETGTDTTDSNGQATFTYTGNGAGTDTIRANFTCSQCTPPTIKYSNTVEKIWESEIPGVPEFGLPAFAMLSIAIVGLLLFRRFTIPTALQ